MRVQRNIIVAIAAAAPALLFAFSHGPVVMRTGAPVDGGLDCTACHRTFAPANSDPRGSVTIHASDYTPGTKQTITVSVQHPEASRWGFQLTARLASDPSKEAGTFSTNDLVRVRCDNTHDAPCNGGLEFAEHNDAPFTGVGAGFTFSIDWTPPAANSGDVIFYAAGNAANGDGTFNGDHIYTTSLKIQEAGGCALTTTPVVTSVVNAGSFASPIAAGAMISVFGTGFQRAGVSKIAGSSDFDNHAFPRALSCVAVEMDGKRVPVTFASETQINAQALAGLSAGPVPVRVILNPDQPNQAASVPVMAQVQSFAPAFFTFSKTAVAATVANSATPIADPSVINGAVFAKPGDIVTLWATGLGSTNPSFPEGAIVPGAAPCNGTIALTIGGQTIASQDVSYVGLSPQSISGLYQINVKIPDAIPDGNVPVTAQAGGAGSQAGITIAIKR